MGAFNHILNDLTVIVNQFEQLSSFSAGIERLSTFLTAMRDADPTRNETEGLLTLPSEGSGTITIKNDVANGHLVHQSTLTEMEPIKIIGSTIELNFGSRKGSDSILEIDGLRLMTPDNKRTLIDDLHLNVKEGENLLIVGSSGAGKR